MCIILKLMQIQLIFDCIKLVKRHSRRKRWHSPVKQHGQPNKMKIYRMNTKISTNIFIFILIWNIKLWFYRLIRSLHLRFGCVNWDHIIIIWCLTTINRKNFNFINSNVLPNHSNISNVRLCISYSIHFVTHYNFMKRSKNMKQL